MNNGIRQDRRTPASRPVSMELFRPIFIVGCQRSGTTALSVMFDRHSAIAIPAETQYYFKFVPADRQTRLPMTHEQLLARACDDYFVRLAELRYQDTIDIFRRYPPTYSNLLRALLESHAAKFGKRRAGEKSCDHLRFADRLLKQFPGSVVICILRDGRDVVRSINAAWGPQRWTVLCRQWVVYARLARHWLRSLPADRFTIVKYHDLMQAPERELRRLCAFVGEEFEPPQLETGSASSIIPESEKAWKGKALDRPDPTRVDAWRTCEDPTLIAKLNFHMGRELRRWGFGDTEVVGIPWTTRLRWWIEYIPCWPGVYPVALAVHRALRMLRHRMINSSAHAAEV